MKNFLIAAIIFSNIQLFNTLNVFSCGGQACNIEIQEHLVECECIAGNGCNDFEILHYRYVMCGPTEVPSVCSNLYNNDCGKKWPCLTDWAVTKIAVRIITLTICGSSCAGCISGQIWSCPGCVACITEISGDDWCDFIEDCYPDVNSVTIIGGYCTCVSAS
ncbi:MAG: hypothetical protein HPY51_19205 [Candidatus Omnitrophica bacterium]|nr:hypothetical protein [Candidatus Omnitrophota bacterium]